MLLRCMVDIAAGLGEERDKIFFERLNKAPMDWISFQKRDNISDRRCSSQNNSQPHHLKYSLSSLIPVNNNK